MEGQLLPGDYRGSKPSPALSWTPGPTGTKSYAIVFKDITPGFSMNFMHWVIYDIPAATTSLPMGVPTEAMLTAPAMAKQPNNYSGAPGYIGPGAPSGTNMYRFTIYALSVDALPGVTARSTGAQIETAAEGASKLATATLNIKSMP
jgi:Raf kinase inhibitor-like YbhB/YbcL family protein